MDDQATSAGLARVAVAAAVISLVAVTALLAFAWPAGRITPRELPIGIVGINAQSERIARGLDHQAPAGFDVHLYADEDAARTAIEHRAVYGAFAPHGGSLTVLTASAASPTVAQLLTTTGDGLAAQESRHGAVEVVDVVPAPRADPRGLIFNATLLPLTIAGLVVASVLGLALPVRGIRRRLSALAVVAAITGAAVYLVAQPFLGALPHEHLATAGALALMVLAIGATGLGAIGVLGVGGLGVVGPLMLLGNAFSGVTSAPELLPDAVHRIGQWMPPGAGMNLLRSTAQFHGNDSAGHLGVLCGWVAVGVGLMVIADRFPARLAAVADAERADAPEPDTATPRHLEHLQHTPTHEASDVPGEAQPQPPPPPPRARQTTSA